MLRAPTTQQQGLLLQGSTVAPVLLRPQLHSLPSSAGRHGGGSSSTTTASPAAAALPCTSSSGSSRRGGRARTRAQAVEAPQPPPQPEHPPPRVTFDNEADPSATRVVIDGLPAKSGLLTSITGAFRDLCE